MRPGGRFRLVYLLRNTITNLTTQEEQTQPFHNVAAQLQPVAHESARSGLGESAVVNSDQCEGAGRSE